MPRSIWPSAATLACLTLLGSSFAAGQAPAKVDVTLFGWSDQHVKTDGDGRHVEPAIDAITNRDELLAAFGDARVVLGGHYHKSKVDRAGGIPFVQLPSPAANGQKQVTVIRITAERVLAVPYDYQQKRWVEGPGQAIDEPLRKPAAETR